MHAGWPLRATLAAFADANAFASSSHAARPCLRSCVCRACGRQVIIGAPTVVGDDLLRTFGIRLVVRGSVAETAGRGGDDMARCAREARAGRLARCSGAAAPVPAAGRRVRVSLKRRPSLPAARAQTLLQHSYALPRERGMFRQLASPSDTTTRSIITRILDNRAAFEARNAKKVASEAAYYSDSKGYVKEV